MGLFDFLRRRKAVPHPAPPPARTPSAGDIERLYALMAAKCGEGCDADEIPGTVGEFGLVATNPVPTHTILGSNLYLRRLTTADGRPVQYHRIGSFRPEGINQPVDGYRIADDAGRELAMIYLCPYHRRNSEKAPGGFSLR